MVQKKTALAFGLVVAVLVAMAVAVVVDNQTTLHAVNQLPSNITLPNENIENIIAQNTDQYETFEPPVGAADHPGSEGPWARRILSATSQDGLVWTKTNTIITDQADVPSLVIDDEGKMYMYYYGWTVGAKQNVPAIAISEDNGTTWTFIQPQFTGFPDRGDVADPEVLFEDGVFRLYGTAHIQGRAQILYGESTDGVSFTYKAVAFAPKEGDAGVASVYRVADQWHMLALSTGVQKQNSDFAIGEHWYAVSEDGKVFSERDTKMFTVGSAIYFIGNIIPVAAGYRLYLFSDGEAGIRSWFSTDGEDWSLEDDLRVELETALGNESGYVGEPEVVQLADGSYFMTYVTLIPVEE